VNRGFQPIDALAILGQGLRDLKGRLRLSECGLKVAEHVGPILIKRLVKP
jgi:hypothetical protein